MAALAQGGDQSATLDALLLDIEAAFGGEMLASILLVDGGVLRAGAAPSLPAEYTAALDGIAIGPAVGSCGTAVHYGEPVIVSDIANDPLWADFRDLALPHGLRACWSTPIRAADGRILGAFANYYREKRAPALSEIQDIAAMVATVSRVMQGYLPQAA